MSGLQPCPACSLRGSALSQTVSRHLNLQLAGLRCGSQPARPGRSTRECRPGAAHFTAGRIAVWLALRPARHLGLAPRIVHRPLPSERPPAVSGCRTGNSSSEDTPRSARSAVAFRRAALFDAGETRTNSKGRFEVLVPRPDLWPHLWPKERQQQQPLWASLWPFWEQGEDCEEG